MRAGQLDTLITIERASGDAVDGAGTPSTAWSAQATVRAQIIQADTEEFIRGGGASDETIVIFRVRYLEGVTNADRVIYDGVIHNIKETKEIGRGKGLDIRTVSQGEVAL